MAKVKVFLEEGETELDAQIALEKAMSIHSTGDAHIRESFEDPAMIDTTYKVDAIQDKIYNDMIREIIEELDKEHGM